MLRELAIYCYLVMFRIVFTICKLVPQQNKTTFVASFGDNISHVAQETERLTDHKIVFLKTASCRFQFDNIKHHANLKFETVNLIDLVQSIYHLATSKVIFVDNYFGFLSVTNFKENVTCVQLWHAAGAIKQFGLMDPTIRKRGTRANKRFKEVYNRFQYLVVGSEKMSLIYQKSFGVSNQQILRTGIPRTDFFYNHEETGIAKHALYEKMPLIKNKKVILYAPTFRDHELGSVEIKLDVAKMYKELKDTHVLLLRLHPVVKGELPHKHDDFIIDVSDYKNINELLVISDLLITDYSSIPFEFSILGKPMVFYSYDLADYENSRGFWENYREQMPGPIVENCDALIQVIQSNTFDLNEVKKFSAVWNQYSQGNSSANIVNYLYGTKQKKSKS